MTTRPDDDSDLRSGDLPDDSDAEAEPVSVDFEQAVSPQTGELPESHVLEGRNPKWNELESTQAGPRNEVLDPTEPFLPASVAGQLGMPVRDEDDSTMEIPSPKVDRQLAASGTPENLDWREASRPEGGAVSTNEISPLAGLAGSASSSAGKDEKFPKGAAGSARTAGVRSAAGTSRSVSSLLLLLLISYASAMTIGFVYLLLTRGEESARHQLEDLRDPVDESGTVRIYQRGAELPPGHRLALGERQRFGKILVEPLRVTLGPIDFDHYSKDAGKTRTSSPPVYKLWLRLTNVSTDQEIAPLDALLLFKRELNREGELVSNTFLAPVVDDAEPAAVFSYPAPLNSEWDIRGQGLGRSLKPGEAWETFIPSDIEGVEALSQAKELRWRFHLRKGYAPRGRGVTTLVEVNFESGDIQRESAGQSTSMANDNRTTTRQFGRQRLWHPDWVEREAG